MCSKYTKFQIEKQGEKGDYFEENSKSQAPNLKQITNPKLQILNKYKIQNSKLFWDCQVRTLDSTQENSKFEYRNPKQIQNSKFKIQNCIWDCQVRTLDSTQIEDVRKGSGC